jgi:hypothetical protein
MGLTPRHVPHFMIEIHVCATATEFSKTSPAKVNNSSYQVLGFPHKSWQFYSHHVLGKHVGFAARVTPIEEYRLLAMHPR